jgi:uncharacterized protein
MMLLWAAMGAGLMGGALSGLFGIGGGVVLVPLLGLALHLDQHEAQGLTLAAMLLPNGAPAVWHYRQAGVRVQWRLVGLLILGFIGGVWFGARIANLIPAVPLRWCFITFLLWMAIRAFLPKSNVEAHETDALRFNPLVVLIAVCIGACGGLGSGLLGIGGGIVLIPLMRRFFRLNQHEAQVTSLAVMLPPIGLPGIWVYAQGHPLPWKPLGMVAFGFAIGAYLGARLATRLRGPKLQRIFAGMILLLAFLLMWRN